MLKRILVTDQGSGIDRSDEAGATLNLINIAIKDGICGKTYGIRMPMSS